MLRNFLLIALFSCFSLAGCVPSPFYQKEEAIPGNEWQNQFQPTFKFIISDTTTLYNIYFLIRHTDAYPYSNIWIWAYIKAPGDSTFKKMRINVPLAESSGKWLGRGMGEIWEHRILITQRGDPGICRKAGTYEIKLQQDMRVNPLPEILHVGLRVEKAELRNNVVKK